MQEVYLLCTCLAYLHVILVSCAVHKLNMKFFCGRH